MKILVTGSAGFLGTPLVRALADSGHSVLGIDRFPDPRAPSFLRHDLRDPLSPRGWRFDVCIHLASEVGGFLANATARGIEENELRLLRTVEQICRDSGCRRLLYASTINVFETGAPFVNGPLADRELRTPYARAKASAEAFVQGHFDQFVIFRPTNLFGPQQWHRERSAAGREGTRHVIPELLEKIYREDQLDVLGDGSQVRNFLHVSDAVSFLSAVLTTPARGWFNLRSDLFLSMSVLARELLRWTGHRRDLVYHPEYLAYEPRPIESFDVSPARSLGWEPAVHSLAQGLGVPPEV
jgi:UDP-glucose 4-epimerase